MTEQDQGPESQPTPADAADARRLPEPLAGEPSRGNARGAKRERVRRFLLHAALGVVVVFAATRGGLLLWRGEHELLIGAIIAGLMGLTRARTVNWIACVVLAGTMLIAGYTPLAPWLARGLSRSDKLEPAPAVVVLNSFVFKDGTLSASAQERIVHGYEVLCGGYAPRLVLTAGRPPAGSWETSAREQMRALGLDRPIDIVGPVGNTHDEAVAIAELARRNNWDRVILVTHPWHMRRAAAVFEKAGLKVICSPCQEGRYDYRRMDSPGDRIGAFGYWLHEAIGYRVYRMRGWAD